MGDQLIPHTCPLCTAILGQRGVCGTCWASLSFLSQECCLTCGFPFPFSFNQGVSDVFSGMVCGGCIAQPPSFDRALGVCAYDAPFRKLFFRFKHGKDLTLAPLFAQWLYGRGAPLWGEADVLIPVPLHWRRLAWRSFNQAAVLCHALAPLTGVKVVTSCLKRLKATKSQGHLTHAQRMANVSGVFGVPDARHIQGARVVLVDDVYTTGATVMACAKTLRRAGAHSICVLTLGRVVRPRRLVGL